MYVRFAWLHSCVTRIKRMLDVRYLVCSMAGEFGDVIIEIAEYEKEQLSNCLFAGNSCVVDGID